jgi:hypothetical protein
MPSPTKNIAAVPTTERLFIKHGANPPLSIRRAEFSVHLNASHWLRV